MRRAFFSVMVLAFAYAAVGCGGGAPDTPATQTSSQPAAPVAVDKNAYPVFPNADEGADPGVPADQGGRGFTGEGWETNTNFDLIGDPRAVKGGVLRDRMVDFPATLRYIGPNLSVWNAMLAGLVYETLLGTDPITLEYIPVLATHWQVSADKQTYRFRLDPNARFSDGSPVTSEDVIASWKLHTDKTVQDPFRNAEYGKFEPPVAESQYIVRVKAKEKTWQSLMIFSGMFIYPSSQLKGLAGAQYIKEWNDKMLAGTGAYMVTPADVDKGKTVRIRRRKDYWAERYRRNIGTSNFDEIREITVRDENLAFEMVKKGDLDYIRVTKAQQWVQDLDYDKIKRGQIQKRKIWNHKPESIQGTALNMRRKPFDDVRVRAALRYLYNREQMIEKLAFNEYVPMDSVFPGSIYENPNNLRVRYDPQKAVQLLADAGWKSRNERGLLVKDGAPLSVDLLYYSQGFEKYYTVFQDDLRKVGITLNLRYVTPETAYKILDDQTFDMMGVGYGGGGPFPLPSQFFDSKQADQKSSNNVTGFKNARVDQILKDYELEFDLQKRIAQLRELDALVMADHPYIFDWTAPFERVLFWNKFGYPKGVITRIGDYRDAPGLWWLDPQKDQALQQSLRDPSKNLPVGDSDDKYWLEFARVEEQKGTTNETKP